MRCPVFCIFGNHSTNHTMKIGLLTGGGDAPGLNAVIRTAVLSAVNRGWEVLGIRHGFAGLLGDPDIMPLTRSVVSGIAHLGGTILRTTNRGNPLCFPVLGEDGKYVEKDCSPELIENVKTPRHRCSRCHRWRRNAWYRTRARAARTQDRWRSEDDR